MISLVSNKLFCKDKFITETIIELYIFIVRFYDIILNIKTLDDNKIIIYYFRSYYEYIRHYYYK